MVTSNADDFGKLGRTGVRRIEAELRLRIFSPFRVKTCLNCRPERGCRGPRPYDREEP